MKQLVVEIYESGRNYPAVVHVFVGKTEQEARGYYDAHLKYDKFLRDSVKLGRFGDMNVEVNFYIKEK